MQDFARSIGRQSYVGLSRKVQNPYVTIYYNIMVFSAGDECDDNGKLVGPAIKQQRHLL